MGATFTSILLHVVFSTKNRRNLIAADFEDPLYGYVGGILRNQDCRLLCAGGTANHAHLLISMAKDVKVVDMVEAVKRESSKWVKTQGAGMSRFYWQEGYGAFSIGQSGVERLQTYIRRQKQHHGTVSFQDEFLALLAKYRIPYDERYIWR